MNKKFINVIICSLITFLLLANCAWAVNLDVGMQFGNILGLGQKDARVTIASIIRTSLGLLGILAIFIIAYGGILYLKSKNDPSEAPKAKKVIFSGLTGLVIILVAFSTTSYILSKLVVATGALPGEQNQNATPLPDNNNGAGQLDNDNNNTPGSLGAIQAPPAITISPNNTYALSLSLNQFYNYGLPNSSSANINTLDPFFNNNLKGNRSISFIYKDTSDPASTKYYLVNIHSKAGENSGVLDATITNAKDNFTIVLRDDVGQTYTDCTLPMSSDAYADCGSTIHYHNIWSPCCTDGEAIYLGDGSTNLNFNLTINSFVSRAADYVTITPSEWYFYSAGSPNGTLIANQFPATLNINLKFK